MLGKAIGIDFGTSSIKFYKNGEGIILHEKSVIAIYNKSHTFAVGNEAYEMYEKAPANIQDRILFPITQWKQRKIRKWHLKIQKKLLRKLQKNTKS